MRITITPRQQKARKPNESASPAPVSSFVPGRRTSIAAGNLQAMLDSAPNAVAKGQAQWHTPTGWGAVLSLALPAYRPIITDLTAGNGQLLAGCRAPGTHHLLGCDIEALPADPEQLFWACLPACFINADVTLAAALLHQASWRADCFVLNPPFDLHWYRDRFPFMAESTYAISRAFERQDGRTSKVTVDSTIATLCLALDRCSAMGEGFIIANAATVERLLYAPNAPHRELAQHIWARLTIPGNICDPATPIGDTIQTAVLYFARSHVEGCRRHIDLTATADALAPITPAGQAQERARLACEQLGKSRLAFRGGVSIRQFEGGHTANTHEVWNAVGLEWRTRQGCNLPGDQRWNIWLNLNGTIGTNLTPFQNCMSPHAEVRLKKAQYSKLHALKGKHPMQLILQKAERRELENAVFGVAGAPSPWRVAPAVTAAVASAIADYNTKRAPLYPLNQIQRFGYLDDNEDILCLKDITDPHSPVRAGLFRAGRRYAIRTITLGVERLGRKMNLTGELDDVQFSGSELALFAMGEDKKEHLFMEERLRKSDVRLSIQPPNQPSPIEFNLQQLVENFEIPEVPDVASQDPAGYQRNLDLLAQIEAIVNA